jgi:hypothetical protein
MNQHDAIEIVSLTVSVAATIAAATWYILTKPKHRKNVILTAFITVVVVVLLVGGVLHFFTPNNPTTVPPNNPTTVPPNNPTTVPPNNSTTVPPNNPITAGGATQTATIAPSSTNYTTITPGEGCDVKGGIWTTINSSVECAKNGTIITKTLDTGGSFDRWGEQRFQIPGYRFPNNYSVEVTISGITDPDSTVQGCAGVLVHMNQGGTSAEGPQICSGGRVGFFSKKNGVEVDRIAWPGSVSSAYRLSIQVTSTTLTLTVNGEAKYTVQAYLTTTSFISLTVFWSGSGANAFFADFRYTE